MRRPWLVVASASVKGYFRSIHAFALFPLGALILPLALWTYVGSPFSPAFLAVWIATESLYGNIFFGSPRELEALAILPLRWNDVVRGKNIAAVATTGALLAATSSVVWYVLPERPQAEACLGPLLVALVTSMLLVLNGNRRSVSHPRRVSRWDFDGIAAAGFHGLVAGVFSGILFLVLTLPLGLWIVFVIGIATGVIWNRRSVPSTVQLIERNFTEICLTAETPLSAPASPNGLQADIPSSTG